MVPAASNKKESKRIANRSYERTQRGNPYKQNLGEALATLNETI